MGIDDEATCLQHAKFALDIFHWSADKRQRVSRIGFIANDFASYFLSRETLE